MASRRRDRNAGIGRKAAVLPSCDRPPAD